MDILEQAEQVAASYLSLVELLAESKTFQANNQSRLVCRCPGCLASRARTLMWTRAMREAPAPASDLPSQEYAATVEHASQGIASD
ncbi:MAG TPA: hypothetical protein VNN10_09685 [Dehalococcoidia bacterium]|nr:hypothetical protein [Dehalococcoidia bacterium]